MQSVDARDRGSSHWALVPFAYASTPKDELELRERPVEVGVLKSPLIVMWASGDHPTTLSSRVAASDVTLINHRMSAPRKHDANALSLGPSPAIEPKLTC